MTLLSNVNNAAQQGAFGRNPRSEPTPAQLAAGNYKKGVVDVHGLSIAIENPAYTYRKGMDKSGKQWLCLMQAHYGYIQGHKGNDGDEMDVFIGVVPELDTVYIVNQKTANGFFDEHKIMIGFLSQQQAVDTYQHCFERGWTGLMSVVPCTMTQFKWWLSNGDKSRPVSADRLPYAGLERLDSVIWGGNDGADLASHSGQPFKLLYQIRQCDPTDQALEPMSFQDMVQELGNQGAIYENYDALVVEYNKLERKAKQLLMVMQGANSQVKPVGVTVSKPLTLKGVANVVAWFEMDDGQAVGVFFHNPDKTPKKIDPTDEMISYKWVLNKKDITIAVAPEQGKDLVIRTVAKRIMQLVEKNHDRFLKANNDKAALNQEEQDLTKQVADKEGILKGLESDIAILEAKKAAVQPATLATEQITSISAWDSGQADKDMQNLLTHNNGDHVTASKDYFTQHLQGTSVQTKIGLVYINSKSKGKMLHRLRQTTARVIPRIPEILTLGDIGERTLINKERSDAFVAFYQFDKWLNFEDVRIHARIKVGELPNSLLAYYLAASTNKEAPSLDSSWAENEQSFQARSNTETRLDSIEADDDEDVNIEILEIVQIELATPVIATSVTESDNSRPTNWRTNLANARSVAKGLGIDTKSKSLVSLVAAIDGKDEHIEVEDLATMGEVEITSQGNENIYFSKGGQNYYSKVYNTEQYPVGKFDLSQYPKGLPKAVQEPVAQVVASTPVTPQAPVQKWSDLYYVRDMGTGAFRVASLSSGNPISPSYLSKSEAEQAAATYFETGDFPTDPVATDNNLDRIIKIAADSVQTLRKADVYRVLENTPLDDRWPMADYIKSFHPDYAQEVDDSMADLSKEAAPVPASSAFNEDVIYLTNVINGDVDFDYPDELESTLVSISERLTPETEQLFEQAAEAFAQYAIAQAATV